MSYVFGTIADAPPGETADHDTRDREVSTAMMQAWTAFAASGNPNAPTLPRWAPYDPAADNAMAFGDSIEPVREWRKPQLDFIDQFYELSCAPAAGAPRPGAPPGQSPPAAG